MFVVGYLKKGVETLFGMSIGSSFGVKIHPISHSAQYIQLLLPLTKIQQKEKPNPIKPQPPKPNQPDNQHSISKKKKTYKTLPSENVLVFIIHQNVIPMIGSSIEMM